MKILFITSLDFGELSLATYFCRNQAFKSAFVIPKQRASYFDEVVDIMYVYNSFSDLNRIIKNESPDVISLNTAYLLVDGGLGTMEEFITFFEDLKQIGCLLITTDPFVRLYDKYPNSLFQLHGRPVDKLKNEMKFLSNMLVELPHMYAFPPTSNHKKAYSFYNNNFCKPKHNQDEGELKLDRWLFVLGKQDYSLCITKYGENFVKEFINRLKEVRKNSDNFIRCVCPEDLTDVLVRAFDECKNIEVY